MSKGYCINLLVKISVSFVNSLWAFLRKSESYIAWPLPKAFLHYTHMTHKSKRIPQFSPKKNFKKIKEIEVLQFCVETRILHVKWFLLWLNYNFSLTWMFPLVFKVK